MAEQERSRLQGAMTSNPLLHRSGDFTIKRRWASVRDGRWKVSVCLINGRTV
jgi:hypothetical protein